MSALTTISLPISLCRDLGLYGGSAHALRMLLVAEHHRPDGASDVTVPLRALMDATGSRAVTFGDGVRHMLDVRCTLPLGDDGLPIGGGFNAVVDEPDEPEDEAIAWDGGDDRDFEDEDDDEDAQGAAPPAPAMASERPDRGTYVVGRARSEVDAPAVPGRLHVAYSPAWVEHVTGPRVDLPMDELRALTTRAGLVMRLRAAALLGNAATATVRLTTGEWSHYTAHDVALQPAGVVRGYLRPGVEDIGRACATVSVDMRERTRGGRVTGVDLTFRRERGRTMSSRVSKPKASKVRPNAA